MGLSGEEDHVLLVCPFHAAERSLLFTDDLLQLSEVKDIMSISNQRLFARVPYGLQRKRNASLATR